MPFAHFHPLVQQWFASTLGPPTATQLRGWDAIVSGRDTLIAAPTGSGKTLAAFLAAIDELTKEGLRQPLADKVRVVYVSPLKALSTDIHRNLAEPLAGIRRLAHEAGLPAPAITTAVRTGDTTSSERAAMLRTPPHILVTTPESLYLLLTSDRSRAMLRDVETVIVDEIHAVIGTRRGAHLALSLERLEHVAGRRAAPHRLVGDAEADRGGRPLSDRRRRAAMRHRRCRASPRRWISAVEIPRSPLEAVMAHEVWERILRPAGRVDPRPSHDAGLRQHAAHGGAAHASSERAAGRRGGDGASRQPVEGETAGCRNAAEIRRAERARGDGVARARHRHRPCRSRLPDWLAEQDCDVPAARRPFRPHDRRPAEGTAVRDVA